MSFHTLNRFYLLASLVLSLTIPLISYERTEIVVLEPQPIEQVFMPTEEIQESTFAPATQQATNIEVSPEKDIDWLMLLNAIYLLGVGLMFMFFCKNILLIVYRIKKTASTSLSYRENLKILLTQSQSNSSFFNYIFLNPENLNPHEQELIIAHESFHAQRLHTLDLLFSSILKAIFWFNPIVYFYQKSLKQIHEYEVDALMSATYDGREYAHLLLKLGVAPNALTINQFSTKPLSERIQFLFKTPTKNMKKLLYLLSLPLIAVGVMAFAEEKVVRVYQENSKNKTLQKSMPTQSPLRIFYKNIQDKNVPSLMSFSERNLTINDLFLLPAATYYYVNPNFLTIEGIKEVNTKLKDKGYAIIVNEQEKDSQNNLTKLTLSIKNLKTQKTTQTREIDMIHAKEVGKQGAWLFFEIFKNHFQDSDVILTEGTSDLEINVGEKIATAYVNITSNLRISKGEIVYKVSPDKLNLKTLEKVKRYFAKEGFILTTKSEFFDSKNNLTSLTIQINNGKEKVEKQIILNDLRHIVKSKNSKTFRPQRADESIVIEANKESKKIDISLDNRWLDLFRKSGNFEVLKVTNNINLPKIDSSKFNYTYNAFDFKFSLSDTDSFKLSIDNKLLTEGKDYIVKNNKILLNAKYKGKKTYLKLYRKPTGSIVYPELTQLNKVEFPDMRFASKTPIVLAKNDNNSPFRYTTLQTRPSTPFSNVAKNQDTLRTILETNKLGKNPLVFINGEEYPSSILYRINPDAVLSMVTPTENGEKLAYKYGEKAKDGIVRLSTKKNVDFLLKNEKEYQIALENVKNQMTPIVGRVKRVLLKDLNGKVTEKISVIDTKTGIAKISMRTDVGKKAIFFIDNVLVSEEEVNNYSGELFHNGYLNDVIEAKYPKEVKSADMIFSLKTKRN